MRHALSQKSTGMGKHCYSVIKKPWLNRKADTRHPQATLVSLHSVEDWDRLYEVILQMYRLIRRLQVFWEVFCETEHKASNTRVQDVLEGKKLLTAALERLPLTLQTLLGTKVGRKVLAEFLTRQLSGTGH